MTCTVYISHNFIAFQFIILSYIFVFKRGTDGNRSFRNISGAELKYGTVQKGCSKKNEKTKIERKEVVGHKLTHTKNLTN